MKKVFSIINALLALLFAAVPSLIVPVCNTIMPNGKHMSCHYTKILIIFVSAIILVIAILALIIRKNWFYVFSYVITALLALFCYLAPTRMIRLGNMKLNGWAVGLCRPDHHMMCSHTMPVVTAVVIVFCVANLLFSVYAMIARKAR